MALEEDNKQLSKVYSKKAKTLIEKNSRISTFLLNFTQKFHKIGLQKRMRDGIIHV